MSDNKQRYLSIEQGRTEKQLFRIKSPTTGLTYNLQSEGYVYGKLSIRTAALSDGGVELLMLDTNNGGVNIEYIADDGTGKSWSGYLYVSDSAMAALLPFEDAIYDFYVLHSGGSKDTVSRGPAMLIKQVAE